MHVLRVAQKVYPDTKGGGQYHVHAMSRDQVSMGHDVTVLTTRERPELPQLEERDGYSLVRVDPGVTLYGNDISPTVAQYLLDADRNTFDVIHAHSHIYFSTNLSALKSVLGDVPVAITNHGLYSQSVPERLFQWYLRTLGRLTFDLADIVFCYSETEKQELRKLGVSSRIEVVPNGIDTNRFTPDGLDSTLVDNDGPRILFVGRLVEGKRPELALESFAEVLRVYPDAKLYFCGDGPLRTKLETRVTEFGIADAVEFLDHVPYDEMPNVYRSGDVLVLPSRTEGIPRTVLEAMATGVPVVCSELDQLRGLVNGHGDLVHEDDPKAFAEHIRKWLDSASIPPHNAHTWETTVEQTSTHLQSILHQRDVIRTPSSRSR